MNFENEFHYAAVLHNLFFILVILHVKINDCGVPASPLSHLFINSSIAVMWEKYKIKSLIKTS